MKRIILLSMIIVLLICNGCYWGDRNRDPFRVLDQDNTRWVSDEPEGYFDISSITYDTKGYMASGKIKLNEEDIEVILVFFYGRIISFLPISAYEKHSSTSSEYFIFSGKGTYYNEEAKLVIEITSTSDKIEGWPENLKKITFYRVAMD